MNPETIKNNHLWLFSLVLLIVFMQNNSVSHYVRAIHTNIQDWIASHGEHTETILSQISIPSNSSLVIDGREREREGRPLYVGGREQNVNCSSKG